MCVCASVCERFCTHIDCNFYYLQRSSLTFLIDNLTRFKVVNNGELHPPVSVSEVAVPGFDDRVRRLCELRILNCRRYVVI